MRLQHNPEWKWLWVDEDGDAYVYEMKPQLDKLGGYILKNGSMPSKLSRDEFDCSLICKHTNSLYEILEDGTLVKYVEHPDFITDDRVLVRNEMGCWFERHFAGWNDDGMIRCWTDGRTSWTAFEDSDLRISIWPYWKLPEENRR